jgi:DNA-binding beta-propeller fold protein YncE
MSLVRAGFVGLPRGPQPGFDHADTYRRGRRMYVAHTGADRVDVLDCDRRIFLRSLPELPGVAGVLVDAHDDLLVTSDRAVARVSLFRCSDEQLLGRLPVGPHPNGLAYDQKRRRVYSFNLGDPPGNNCSASVIDVDSLQVIAELTLPGRPRWAVYDPARDLVYANIRDPAEITVVDCERAAITRQLPVPAAGPHGLWLDRGRLFCAGVPDVVMLDPELRRAFVAVGDPGVVCSFDTDQLEPLDTVDTEQGAHTCGWDPDDRCLYVFCPTSSRALLFEERD